MLRRHEDAFSLIELIVIMAIVGMLAALAAPSLGRWLTIMRINATARAIASHMQLSRMLAISQNTTFRLNVSVDDGTYQIQKRTGGTWEDVKELETLPAGITLVSASGSPEFESLGTTPENATIVVRNALGSTRTIHVSTVGRVTIE